MILKRAGPRTGGWSWSNSNRVRDVRPGTIYRCYPGRSQINMKRLAYILFIIFSAWAVWAVSSFGGGKPPLAVAHRGVMDLRSWDFAAAGPVELGGQWEFYWERFLIFDDFKTRLEPSYVRSGKVWNDTVINGRKMPGTGYATYRLKVMTSGELTRMGLRSPDASSACRVYINDTLIYEAGVPGESEEKTRAF